MTLTGDYRNIRATSIPESYYSIGDGMTPEPFRVWAWIDGQLKVSDLYEPKQGGWSPDEDDETEVMGHSDLWDSRSGESFRGRYEPGTRRLSVMVPGQWRHRELPGVLLRELGRAFNYSTISKF